MSELWELIWGKPHVDPRCLSKAIENELDSSSPDFRTRLLIRDGTQALMEHWGAKRLREWLSASPVGAKIESIRNEELGETGFPRLKERLMDRTEPETVKQFLRELGTDVREPVNLAIGGAIALILTGYISRATEDIDVIDEVPKEIRSHSNILEELSNRYHLLLTQFQSHYLPAGWKDRLQFQGSFGSLSVYTADVYDICIGKLFSNRRKDLDDLREVIPRLEKDQLIIRLTATAGQFLSEPPLRQAAEHNWYILFGEALPS